MSAQITTGAVLMIGVLALLFDVPFLLPVVVALVGYTVASILCTATTLLIRWATKLLLAPLPRAAVALGASVLLHALAWWDGWHPFRGVYPLEEALHVLVFLLFAHVPAAILLLRDLGDAGPGRTATP
jgi:hypothetical protein